MPNLNSRPVGRHVKNSILKKFWNTCVLDVVWLCLCHGWASRPMFLDALN